MRISALATLVAASFVLVLPSSAQLHWSRTVRFQPTDHSVRGIPVSTLDPEWRKASLLSYEAMPPEADADLQSMRDGGIRFSIESDLDQNSVVEETVVGVFETEARERGSFVAVLIPLGGSRYQAALVQRLTGPGGFYALRPYRDGISVAPCVACDLFAVLRFREGQFVLDPE
jgi:hypothetical protein